MVIKVATAGSYFHWLILPLPTPAIARGWQLSLLPARLIFTSGFAGDTLTATAQVRHQGKQTGVYDIEIVNQQQKRLRCFAVNLTASAAPLQEKPDA